MKKTYINPSMLVVRLGLTQPIAGSGSLGITGDSGSATFYNADAEGAAMTKGSSDVNVWDDEW
jgi:hypothetical protein